MRQSQVSMGWDRKERPWDKPGNSRWHRSRNQTCNATGLQLKKHVSDSVGQKTVKNTSIKNGQQRIPKSGENGKEH